jgi:uncharacterized protein affecting Mg2+/Co2+ transport
MSSFYSPTPPPPPVVGRQQQQQPQLNLEHLFLNAKGVFLCDHVLPFLAARDVGRLEGVSRTIRRVLVAEQEQVDSNRNDAYSMAAAAQPGDSSSSNSHNNCSSDSTAPWKILWDRDFDRNGALAASAAQCPMTSTVNHLDFYTTKSGPVYNDNSNNNNVDQLTFRRFVALGSWKEVYAAWSVWKNRTRGLILPHDMVRAVLLWSRFKAWVTAAQRTKPALHLEHIMDSLREGLPVQEFTRLNEVPLQAMLQAPPSSVLAFQSVHKGQTYDVDSTFTGLFGACLVYDHAFSMHTTHGEDIRSRHGTGVGFSHPNFDLFLCVGPDGSQLSVMATLGMQIIHAMRRPVVARVGQGGILSYFESYVERLETGIYQADCIVPTDDATGGICLFPAADLRDGSWSCCISHGIEVQASARWMYGEDPRQHREGLIFAYSVRIRMVDNNNSNNGSSSVPWETCQLVGRDWQFTDGLGQVQEVSGEAVIGKQPLFFRQDCTSGFDDLGPAGLHRRFENRVFVYQSQTGPVAGTTPQDTGLASIQGSFSFVPGSIAHPTGAVFHVQVAPFRLTVPFPFY